MRNPRSILPTTLWLLCGAMTGPALAQVEITDATDEGISCFKIVTATATYFYDRAGAGFTSILDKDGNDWIGYQPGGGASGEYRGIPNMGLNQFGHPGYTGASTTTSDAKGTQLAKVTVTSKKGAWHVSWEFLPTHAKMTVHGVAENYWFLYEGTPGGAVGADDVCHRSGGQQNNLDQAWEGDVSPSAKLPAVEWVFFADGALDRSLFMAHDEDSKTDRYYLMSPMTVFGFGRQEANLDRLLDATPATLIIGLIDSRSFGAVEQRIADAWQGTALPPPDAGTPPPKDAGTPPADDTGPAPLDDAGGPLLGDTGPAPTDAGQSTADAAQVGDGGDDATTNRRLVSDGCQLTPVPPASTPLFWLLLIALSAATRLARRRR